MIKSFTEIRSNFELPKVIIKIKADKEIKMSFINQLKDTIVKNNVNKIGFKVLPNDIESKSNILKYEYSLKEKIILKSDIQKLKSEDFDQELLLHVVSKDSISINGDFKDFDKSKIENYIKKYSTEANIILTIDKTATVNDYVFIKSSLNEAYLKVRNQYCLNKNLYSYESLMNEYKRNVNSDNLEEKIIEIRNKYPMLILYDY